MGLEKELDRLRLQTSQDSYQCAWEAPEGSRTLSEMSMTTLTAPTGVGKSTISKRIFELAAQQGIDVCEPGTHTTRKSRADDAANYRTEVSFEEMIERIDNREYINWSVSPSGHLYATTAESLVAKHNFLPSLPDSIPMLRRAGFAAVHSFYIVTTADAWDNQMQDRKGLPDFPGRLEEAKTSLEFGWKRQYLQKIVSMPGDDELTTTSQMILDFSQRENEEKLNVFTNPHHYESFIRHSSEMYRWAILLSHRYEQSA